MPTLGELQQARGQESPLDAVDDQGCARRMDQGLALAMADTECPRKLTESIANFLQTVLVQESRPRI